MPAGKTVAVAAAWKELPRDRSFAFYTSAPSAMHAIVDYKAPPAVIFVNNTKKDIKLHRKQKIGNITECSEESYFSSTWTTALAALTIATAPALGAVSSQSGKLTAFSSLSLPSISQEFPLTEEINAIAARHHQLNWSTVEPGTKREASVPTSLGDAIFQDSQNADLPWKLRRKSDSSTAAFLALDNKLATKLKPSSPGATAEPFHKASRVPY